MRPLQRYRKELAREKAALENAAFVKPPDDDRRGHPKCTSMRCVFDMPDGTTLELEGVWDTVSHLPLDILARAVIEQATMHARRRMPK